MTPAKKGQTALEYLLIIVVAIIVVVAIFLWTSSTQKGVAAKGNERLDTFFNLTAGGTGGLDCGDGVIAGGEDCEIGLDGIPGTADDDLNGMTCQDFGLRDGSSGGLECGSSCLFETTNCVYAVGFTSEGTDWGNDDFIVIAGGGGSIDPTSPSCGGNCVGKDVLFTSGPESGNHFPIMYIDSNLIQLQGFSCDPNCDPLSGTPPPWDFEIPQF